MKQIMSVGPGPAVEGDGVYVFLSQLLQDMCFPLGSESFHSLYAVIWHSAFLSNVLEILLVNGNFFYEM